MNLIRKHYSQDVPIVTRLDGGFMSDELFQTMESLGIGYICGGKLYRHLTEFAEKLPECAWDLYFHPPKPVEDGTWKFIEFAHKCDNWPGFRKAFLTRPLTKDGEFLLPIARPCSVIYTNIGTGEAIDEGLRKIGHEDLFCPEILINTYHGRGNDELNFRNFKQLQDEQLPLKKFKPNCALYMLRVITLFLFESFKQDVTFDVLPISTYVETFRRRLIDSAGRIVNHAGVTILKVAKQVWLSMKFEQLWRRSMSAAPITISV